MGSSFPSDGSFLERFKQLQQESQPELPKSSSSSVAPISIKPSKTPSKIPSNSQESSPSPLRSSGKPSFPNGKLAFTLKQKSKLAVSAIKLGEDDDDDVDNEAGASRQTKKPKLENIPSILPPEDKASDTVPPPPTDPEVKKVADKLSLFVAKNGRQFENITRQKNPGNSPFRFLFDTDCADYKYYEYRVAQEEAALAPEAGGSAAPYTGSGSNAPRFQSSHSRQSSGGQNQRYQTPASALYSGGEDHRRPAYSSGSSQEPAQERLRTQPYANDPVAMMEFYMKKAAREDLRKPPKQSKDEMPPPASLQTSPSRQSRPSPVMWPPEEAPAQEAALPPYTGPSTGVVEDAASVAAKKGHHMGDYIPPEELEKFLAKCNDAKAAKAAKATADRAKIQADNVGHRLLSKMGWKEGEGLGSGRSGRADPVQAGQVKVNNLGVGAEQPGEVTADDDIYEQYKKRMMLGYKFRPNPLNNPRKAYY